MPHCTRSIKVSSRILCFGIQQELRRYDTGTAVIENAVIDLGLHRIKITMLRESTRIGTGDTYQVDLQVAKLLHQRGIGAEVKRPAIGKYPVNPAFEDRRHRHQ